ncbi:MAG: hypothetical protein U0800_11140 [Isosphaeraceae bacterium]
MKQKLRDFLQPYAIILACIAAAIFYGIVHDQITARVCVEYFSVFHPKIIESTDPTDLAFAFGVAATWWVGAILGVPLAIAARSGSYPRRSIGSLVRPVGTLMAVMAACALASGILGYTLGKAGIWTPPEGVAEVLPEAKHPNFLADWAAHNASYAVGFLGGLVVIGRVWVGRKKAPAEGVRPGA